MDEECKDPNCIGCVLSEAFDRVLDRYPEEIVIQATMEILQEAMLERGHVMEFNTSADVIPEVGEMH